MPPLKSNSMSSLEQLRAKSGGRATSSTFNLPGQAMFGTEFADYWTDQDLSDCQVHIRLIGGSTAKSLACHAIVLRARWPYYRAKLAFKKQGSEANPEDGTAPLANSSSMSNSSSSGENSAKRARMCCDVQVTADSELEVQLLELVIHMLYDPAIARWENLPQDPGRVQVAYMLLVLCDKFQAPSWAVWSLVKQIDEIQTFEEVMGFFKCMQQLGHTDDLLTAKLSSALMQLMGDFELYWQDQGNREKFCLLPFHAVHSLFSHREIKVASENTVYWALYDWMHAAMEQRVVVTEEEKKQLVKLIRLGQLHPSFVFDVASYCKDDVLVSSAVLLQSLAKREDKRLNICSYYAEEITVDDTPRLASRRTLTVPLVVPVDTFAAHCGGLAFDGYVWDVKVERDATGKLQVAVAPTLMGRCMGRLAVQWQGQFKDVMGNGIGPKRTCRGLTIRTNLFDTMKPETFRRYLGYEGNLELKVEISMSTLSDLVRGD